MSLEVYDVFTSQLYLEKDSILNIITTLKKELTKKELEIVSYHSKKYSIHYIENTYDVKEDRPFEIDIIYNNGKSIYYNKSENKHETFELKYYEDDYKMHTSNLKFTKKDADNSYHHFDFFSNEISFKFSFNSESMINFNSNFNDLTSKLINKEEFLNLQKIVQSLLTFDKDKTNDYIDLFTIQTDIDLSMINKILLQVLNEENNFIEKSNNQNRSLYSKIKNLSKKIGII